MQRAFADQVKPAALHKCIYFGVIVRLLCLIAVCFPLAIVGCSESKPMPPENPAPLPPDMKLAPQDATPLKQPIKSTQ